MTLTSPTYIVNTTFGPINIATAQSVYTFTAAAAARVYFTVKLTNAAGNDDYIVYLTHGWLGAANPAIVLPKTTAAAASGETIIEFASIGVDVAATDVINVMIDGLPTDIAVNGAIRITADNWSVFQATDTVSLVSTVTTLTGYTAPLTSTQTAQAVLNAVAANYDTALSIGAAINDGANVNLAVTATQAAAVANGNIAIITADTFSQAITSTTTDDLASATKVWFAIKLRKSDPDSASIVFIEKTDGLTVVNGTPYATPLNGTLTVTGSSGAWVVTPGLKEAITAVLGAYVGSNMYAAVKYSLAGVDKTLSDGRATISTGPIQAVA